MITQELRHIIGEDFDDVIKQATPTGCASFQMGPGAETCHRAFGLYIKSKIGDLDEKALKNWSKSLKKGFV